MNDLDKMFFRVSLEEYALAWLEGRALDSSYVKQKTYDRYEYELQKLSENKTTDI
jgi:hypothetical protein